MFRLSTKSKQHAEGVDERLIRLANRALEITKIDFGIPSTGGVRTESQQSELYRYGKSKVDGITRRSKHQDGIALDFYAYVDGKASWEKEHLAQVAAAFLQAAIELNINIRWGGLFKSFLDMPHIELVD